MTGSSQVQPLFAFEHIGEVSRRVLANLSLERAGLPLEAAPAYSGTPYATDTPTRLPNPLSDEPAQTLVNRRGVPANGDASCRGRMGKAPVGGFLHGIQLMMPLFVMTRAKPHYVQATAIVVVVRVRILRAAHFAWTRLEAASPDGFFNRFPREIFLAIGLFPPVAIRCGAAKSCLCRAQLGRFAGATYPHPLHTSLLHLLGATVHTWPRPLLLLQWSHGVFP